MKHQLFTPEIEHYIWRLGERGLSNSYCNSYDEKSLQQLDELFQLIKQIAPISDNGVRELLIIGNHDKDWMKRTNLSGHFASVQLMAEINDGSHKITLCHYPMMSWNGCNKGAFHIHGHIHNNRNDSYWPLLLQMPHALNAGVDVNGFAPVTFNELVENNRIFKESEE